MNKCVIEHLKYFESEKSRRSYKETFKLKWDKRSLGQVDSIPSDPSTHL